MPTRCVNSTTSAVTIDVTPPTAQCAVLPVSNGTASALPLQVLASCDDPESGLARAQLSLGTYSGGTDLLSGLGLELPEANSSDVDGSSTMAVQGNVNATSLDGRVQVSANMLSRTLADGERLWCSLLCENRAGMQTTGGSQEAVTLDLLRPLARGGISPPSLQWHEASDTWYVPPDVTVTSMRWKPFSDGAGSGVVDYQLCIGSKPFSCDGTSALGAWSGAVPGAFSISSEGDFVHAALLLPSSPLSDVRLPPGSSAFDDVYFLTVSAIDGTGRIGSVWAQLRFMEPSPPTLGNMTLDGATNLVTSSSSVLVKLIGGDLADGLPNSTAPLVHFSE